MPRELIDIRVGLSATYWNNPPRAEVHIDDQIIFDSEVRGFIEATFSGNLDEGEHSIRIYLKNKVGKLETVIDNGRIVKDQLLNVDEIYVDEIEIGMLKWTLSQYHRDGFDEPELNCVNLGVNGYYELKFTVPAYLWLLENI